MMWGRGANMEILRYFMYRYAAQLNFSIDAPHRRAKFINSLSSFASLSYRSIGMFNTSCCPNGLHEPGAVHLLQKTNHQSINDFASERNSVRSQFRWKLSFPSIDSESKCFHLFLMLSSEAC